MSGKGRACLGTEAGQDLQNTIRKPCLQGEFSHSACRQRRAFRGLQDQTVSCSQGRAGFPRHTRDRAVPWRDPADYADRLPEDIVEGPGGRCHGVSADLRSGAGEIVQRFHRQRDEHLCSADRHAVIQCFQLGKLVRVLIDQFSPTTQIARALVRAHAWPRSTVKCGARGFHRLVDIGRIGLCGLPQNLLRCRIERREYLARLRRDPLIVDEQTGFVSVEPILYPCVSGLAKSECGFLHLGHTVSDD